MFECFTDIRNRLRGRRDALLRAAQNRGLAGAARLARWALDLPDVEPSENWAEWEYRSLSALLDCMCGYGGRLPRPTDTPALESLLTFVETLPEGRRRQLRDLVALFEAGSLVLGPEGSRERFSELDDAAAETYLRSWEESALPPRRAAFRALKSVCMMAYWSQRETWGPIGYSLEDNPGLDTSR